MGLLGETGGDCQDGLLSWVPLDLSCGTGEARLRREGSLQGDPFKMVTTGAEVALSFGEQEPVVLPRQTCIRNWMVGKHLQTQLTLSPSLPFRVQDVAPQKDQGFHVTREGHR